MMRPPNSATEQRSSMRWAQEVVQDLHTFSLQRGPDQAYSGHVAVRAVEAGNEPVLDGIGAAGEDNRDCGRCGFCDPRRLAGPAARIMVTGRLTRSPASFGNLSY